MKKLIAIVLAVTLVATISGVALAGQGNGLPSGPHYNLNLIGMEKGKNENMGCGNGDRIFVQLSKTGRVSTKINLQEGDFGVIDCDGTDGEATFQLPNPDPDNTGTTEYSVYLRLRGKPGGDIIMQTCGEYVPVEGVYCSDLKVVESRETGHGKNKFNNVSAELLYIYAWVCVEEDDYGECVDWEYMRVPLFAEDWQGFFWDYDNNGVRLAQLRFYEGVSTTVPGIVEIDPHWGWPGDVVAVTITGTGTDFDGGTTLTVVGAGIVVSNIVVVDATTITATFTIDSGAVSGTRLVTVTDDGATYITSFEVK